MYEVRKYTLLLLGHVCHDLKEGGDFALGGTASYASFLAKRLGMEPSIISSYGSDFQFAERFAQAEIELNNIPSSETTAFRNIYNGGHRQQYLVNKANDLHLDEVPHQNYDVVFFCPIADEVPFSLIGKFINSIKVATIQGWLREWDLAGKVNAKDINWAKLQGLDLLIMSDEDLPTYMNHLEKMINYIPVIIVTKGENGASLYLKEKWWHFPAMPTKIKDPTGAGDSFAIGFLYKFLQSGDLLESMIYGNVLSSFIIEKMGIQVPGQASIDNRLKQYPFDKIKSLKKQTPA